MISTIQLSTTNSFDGYETTQYLGIVYESIVVGTNLFSDFFASVSDIFGGQSRSYQKQLYKLRKFALDGLIEKAKEKGANAILGIMIDSDEISGAGKSMFMINVTGTAVRIRKITDRISETQTSIIDGEKVKRHLTLRMIEKRSHEDKFKLDEDEIEMLIQGQVPDGAKFFMKSLYTIKEVDSIYHEDEYKDNLSALLVYLSQFDTQEQISIFYPLVPEYLKLEEVINTVLKSLGLVDYKRIGEWFITGSVELQHFALTVLQIIKAGYSIDDVGACQNVISLLENKYNTKNLEKNGNDWVCVCGKTNSIKYSNCRRCNKNSIGFAENEVQPVEVIDTLQKEISVVEMLLAQI